MNSVPRVLYANKVNLSGLYSPEPIKLLLHDEYDTEEDEAIWWDEDGDLEVTRVGLVAEYGYIIFSSDKLEEVRIWTSGVKSTMILLRQWSAAHEFSSQGDEAG